MLIAALLNVTLTGSGGTLTEGQNYELTCVDPYLHVAEGWYCIVSGQTSFI